MMKNNGFDWTFKRTNQPGLSRRPWKMRLSVEALEGRLVLSGTFTWTGAAALMPGGNDNWSTNGNWLGGAAPKPNGKNTPDDLVFPAGAAVTNTVDDVTPLFMSSLTLDAAYSIAINPDPQGQYSLSFAPGGTLIGPVTGDLTTSGTGTLDLSNLTQNETVKTYAGQVKAGGPIHVGMSNGLPTKPKITKGANAILSIGGGPGEMSGITFTVPGIEVNGTVQANDPSTSVDGSTGAQLIVSPVGGSTTATLSGDGIVMPGGGVYLGQSGTPPSTDGMVMVGAGGVLSPGGVGTAGPLTIDGDVTFIPQNPSTTSTPANPTLSIGLDAVDPEVDKLVLSAHDRPIQPATSRPSPAPNLNLTKPEEIPSGTYTILEAPNIMGTFATVNGQAATSGNNFMVDGVPFVLKYNTTAGPNGLESVTLTSMAKTELGVSDRLGLLRLPPDRWSLRPEYPIRRRRGRPVDPGPGRLRRLGPDRAGCLPDRLGLLRLSPGRRRE